MLVENLLFLQSNLRFTLKILQKAFLHDFFEIVYTFEQTVNFKRYTM